ncbi:MAG: malto-oligosyltrehalose trehalohydrolase [Bryobacterales bacterium]|nr:malto-oligosyltrehalose trehalohydrolase [Bryobacterales bacterium]
MHAFKVWSPLASKVELRISGQLYSMEQLDHGWWQLRVPNAQPGMDYQFVVDGGDALPDPRSRWQPQGVHGPSRLPDATFAWEDQHWNPPPLGSGIVYELHVGTFTAEGTFQAVIDRLDYLVDLGITHIELMPVAEFPGGWGWGYDGVDIYAPSHNYGSPADLKALVNACHIRGLAVLLDVVYNHFGPDGNYLSKFGPYTTERYETPWGNAVNLDGPYSESVRSFFVDNAVMWLRDYHFDGLRLDAVHALIDSSAYHFLEQLADRVRTLEARLGRHLVLIAESDLNDPRIVRPSKIGGYGIDAQWADDFHHCLHAVLTDERSGYYSDFGGLPRLAKALQQAYVYDGCFSEHRKRRHGRAPIGIPGYSFVVCTQNHDQIGNRACGDRLGHLVGQRKAKLAAALLFSAPYVPMIFQGEEWNASTRFQYFTQHEDAELARAVSEGRRNEFAAFGWSPENVPDPQDPGTFKRSKLNWDERSQVEHAGMLAWYRSLIRLRRATPDLCDGDLSEVSVKFNEEESWLLLRRGSTWVACNFGQNPCFVPAPETAAVVLASAEGSRTGAEGVKVPAESVLILSTSSELQDTASESIDARYRVHTAR